MIEDTCPKCRTTVFEGEQWCFICELRTLTVKVPSNATQREKNIYRHACALLDNLENPKVNKEPNENCYWCSHDIKNCAKHI